MMLLYKDGITQEALSNIDIARLKRLGYVEVSESKDKEEKPAEKQVGKGKVNNDSTRN